MRDKNSANPKYLMRHIPRQVEVSREQSPTEMSQLIENEKDRSSAMIMRQKTNSRFMIELPYGEVELLYRRDSLKEQMLKDLESLARLGLVCLKINTGEQQRYNTEKLCFKRGVIESLNFIIRACVSIPEVAILKQALKLLAYVYMYFKKQNMAVSTLERLRDVSMEDLDYPTVMYALKQMGSCFQNAQDYERALICFKTLMHQSWIHGEKDFEMQAYENIALQYYYLGNIEKSSQYHKLMTRGADPNDRPKGYEAGSKQNKQPQKKIAGRDVAIEHVAISKKMQEIETQLLDGSTKIFIQTIQDYSSAIEMKAFCENHFQRITRDIRQLVSIVSNQQPEARNRSLFRIPDPVSLYQQTVKSEKPSYMRETPDELKKQYQLTDWDSVQYMFEETIGSAPSQGLDPVAAQNWLNDERFQSVDAFKESLIKEYQIHLNVLLQPRFAIQLGESVYKKRPQDLPSPRLQNGKDSGHGNDFKKILIPVP